MSEPTLYRRWPDPQGGRWVYLPVERCEHGRIDPHKTQDSYLNFAGRFVPAEWCPGSPTLREADDDEDVCQCEDCAI